MESNKNLKDYLEKFSTLNTNKQQGKIAPHKAVLLLSVIDLIGKGDIQSNKVELTDKLESQYKLNWEKFVENKDIFKPNIGAPYVHLSGESFWKLIPKSSNKEVDLSARINSYSVNHLRSQFLHAQIEQELFSLLLDSNNRENFREVLISTYLISKKSTTMKFYDQLLKFLEQTKTESLQTTGYVNIYNNLKVKVSFGIGTLTYVPWFAFLREGQTVQKGIYPGYLYYKKNKILVLAYCVSATNPSDVDWPLTEPLSISEYMKSKGIREKIKYGDSYVFKAYDVSKPLDEDTIDKDLLEITDYYNSLDFNTDPITNANPIPFPVTPIIPPASTPFTSIHSEFSKWLMEAKLVFNETLVVRFISSLLTKPFIILTGLSGSGKTKLAQSFAMWLCKEKSQYCLIPVGADWTNREPLLGFPNALENKKYVKPDNRVLDLILKAGEDKERPYFLILDEMNLSHVERYFADFLSTMESKGEIFLHEDSGDWDGVPPSIVLPKNLFIIGTVNIDETTYMFSPKVLDRANTIEFRVTEREIEKFLDNPGNLNLEVLKGRGAEFGSTFVNIANEPVSYQNNIEEINIALLDFFVQLKISGAEFGFRTASEIQRLTQIVPLLSPDTNTSEIIDYAILQKLLPKVHGSKRKLEPVLIELIKMCLMDGVSTSNYTTGKAQVETLDLKDIKYPLSLEKIVRMYNNLVQNSFTSFAEA
ncbi:MAG: DUF3578 domain-containing protein [Bacteroidetes bacterium HGW-Bacteroidetes-5]|jgi:5-methylcytosine-specific restriction protein B|nr:MAG: DUF3578 domain-containing protein [Bacteroidetes bacterium HGW-Bacteroidetes-5]